MLDRLRPLQEARVARCRVVLNDLKRAPCTDCGGRFPPICMHYDHRDWRTKQRPVATWTSAGALRQMLEEIERCDLVCANCHAIRTGARRKEEGHRGGRPRRYS
jgi:hypothetical protein